VLKHRYRDEANASAGQMRGAGGVDNHPGGQGIGQVEVEIERRGEPQHPERHRIQGHDRRCDTLSQVAPVLGAFVCTSGERRTGKVFDGGAPDGL
jgi:hypothetical protein